MVASVRRFVSCRSADVYWSAVVCDTGVYRGRSLVLHVADVIEAGAAGAGGVAVAVGAVGGGGGLHQGAVGRLPLAAVVFDEGILTGLTGCT